jgi:hypothetical protein
MVGISGSSKGAGREERRLQLQEVQRGDVDRGHAGREGVRVETSSGAEVELTCVTSSSCCSGDDDGEPGDERGNCVCGGESSFDGEVSELYDKTLMKKPETGRGHT